MQSLKAKAFVFRKNIFVAFLVIVMVFSPVTGTQPAQAWIPGLEAFLRTALDQMLKTILDIVMTALKTAAINALNQEINYLLTGKSSNSASFVTDWKSFLYKEPGNQAKLFLNDYLSQMTRGRGSISGYIASASEGYFGSGMTYAAALQQTASQVISSNDTAPKMTYTGNPEMMFQTGNLRNMNEYFSGINNPWTFNAVAQRAYAQEAEKQKTVATTQSVAYQGFKGSTTDGGSSKGGQSKPIVINPGSLVKDITNKIQGASTDVLTTAQGIGQVIGAIVGQLLSQAITKGIGKVQSQVHKEVVQPAKNAVNQVNKNVSNMGPGALYK